MLSIHPVINQNYRMKPSFGGRPEESMPDEEYQLGLNNLKRQKEEEERKWIERRSEMQEMIDDEKENKSTSGDKPYTPVEHQKRDRDNERHKQPFRGKE